MDDPQELKRENRKLKRELRQLIQVSRNAVKLLDEEMKKPSNCERGKRVARITNALEFQTDSAWHFGLGKPLRRVSKPGRSSPAPRQGGKR